MLKYDKKQLIEQNSQYQTQIEQQKKKLKLITKKYEDLKQKVCIANVFIA